MKVIEENDEDGWEELDIFDGVSERNEGDEETEFVVTLDRNAAPHSRLSSHRQVPAHSTASRMVLRTAK